MKLYLKIHVLPANQIISRNFNEYIINFHHYSLPIIMSVCLRISQEEMQMEMRRCMQCITRAEWKLETCRTLRRKRRLQRTARYFMRMFLEIRSVMLSNEP